MAPVWSGAQSPAPTPRVTVWPWARIGLVKEDTAAVKAAVDIPVIPKLTPNTDNIGEIARAAVAGGVDALCAINTVGPGYTSSHGHPVLSNGAGGMSGKGCCL